MSFNNFFLDIFNKLLKINEDNNMIVFDVDGDIKHTISDIKITKDNKIQYSNMKVVGSTPPPSKYKQKK